MALDPSIPLQVKAAQFESPQEAQARAMQLQSLGQQQQLGALDIQEKRLHVGQLTKDQQDSAAIEDALRATNGDIEKALPAITQIDPLKATQFHAMVLSARKASMDADAAKVQWAGQHLSTVTDEPSYRAFLQQAATLGLTDASAPPHYDPTWVEQHRQQALSLKEQYDLAQKKQEDAAKAPLTASEITKNNAQAASDLASAAEKTRKSQPPDPAKLQAQIDAIVPPSDTANAGLRTRTIARVSNARTVEDAEKALDEAARQMGSVEVAKNTKPFRVSVNPDRTDDVRETVAGMIDGSLPPQLPGRATKEYLALMAEAHRQGYDLAGAATDWAATQKHISTMNGAQQLRLNQSINALPDMLDSVDTLASKWKGGSFPLLNKENLALAKSGAFGKDVATVANQLDAQIADVTADLGNVYMGGNSPTDHALGLAGKSLSGDWDEKVLHDMVALAKKNVGIRKHSINNTGVAGASADNPYAPAPTPDAPPRRVYYDANGKPK